MIKKDVLEKTSAWPFVEAKKMLRERKAFIEKKGKITLQTGYGPSGLPHIGTFGEVARTTMVQNAFFHLTGKATKLISFSDAGNKVKLKVDHKGIGEDYECDYLIGADGANSIVRRNLGIEFGGFTYKEKIFTLSTEKPLENYFTDLSYVNYVSDPDEWFVMLKAPSAWRILVPVDEKLDDDLIRSDDYVRNIFKRALNSDDRIETIHRTIYRVPQRVV